MSFTDWVLAYYTVGLLFGAWCWHDITSDEKRESIETYGLPDRVILVLLFFICCFVAALWPLAILKFVTVLFRKDSNEDK